MAERPTKLPTERTYAAEPHHDIVHKLNYWSEDLRRRGLIVEGTVMFEAATEIMAWRAENGGRGRPRAYRGLVGDVFRGPG